MEDKDKIIVIGAGEGLATAEVRKQLSNLGKDIIIVDDVKDVPETLKGEYHKEVVYQFTKPKLHNGNAWAGDMTKKQINAPEMEPVRSTPKIQNNEPCPCGSGKKYKKCCKTK